MGLENNHDNAMLLDAYQPVSQAAVNNKYSELMSALDARRHKVCSKDGTPLAYVNRNKVYPPASADDPAAEYDSLGPGNG